MNLEVLTDDTRSEFTELTLYSSGNWSVLYHWASEDGLMTLKKVSYQSLFQINIAARRDTLLVNTN